MKATGAVLSLLRFLLAFVVLSGHTSNATGIKSWEWLFGAVTAVYGFFIISGYSIAASITAQPLGYARRRLLRIYPLALCAVIYGTSIAYYLSREGSPQFTPSLVSLIGILVLMNGILTPSIAILAPMGTLSCEIIYYAMAPWLVRVSRSFVLALLVASLIFYVACVGQARYGMILTDDHGLQAMRLMCFWMLGFLAFFRPNDRWLALFGCGGGMLLVCMAPPIYDGVASPLTYGAAAFCICNLSRISLPRRAVPLANYLGELSYPLYLFHMPTIYLVAQFSQRWSTCAIVATCWTTSLLLAIAAYHLIDVPIRKRRFHPRPL